MKDDGVRPERRRFLTWMLGVMGAVGASAVGVPVVGFLVGPLLGKARRQWRDIGALDGFAVGSTVKVAFEDASPLAWAGVTARSAAWVRRTGETSFIAFAVNCSHLGCPVRWLDDAELFMCPCHGGVYYANGNVAAGPPPQPLHRYDVRVRQGRVELEAGPVPITT